MNIQKILLFLVVVFSFFSWSIQLSYAAINFTVTPLKYEIDAEPWETIVRSAQIRNNWPDTVTLPTASSDFEPSGTNGVPRFVRRSELVHPDQQLSSWITIWVPSVTLAPGETQWFDFEINVPQNATPGWHYAAVFFKNPNSETSGGSNIWINVDYGILLLVNVAGEIVVDVDIDDVIISGWSWSSTSSGGWGWWWGWWGWASNIWIDNCPLGDLTASNFDGKCIDNPFSPSDDEENWNSNENSSQGSSDSPTNGSENTESNSDGAWDNWGLSNDFEINFDIPINNNWNTHVQPVWKIRLIDEDGREIPWVGKEAQKNEYGAVIGQEIVDYLPINDQWGNVLPKTKRNFETDWKWFPYKTYDERGNLLIKYKNPGDHYTSLNTESGLYRMPWQRVCERKKTKTIEAVLEIAYKDEKWDTIQYNSAQEFEIEYTEQYLWINPYLIILLFWILFLWLLWWFILAKRKVPCINKDCKKRIPRKTKRCPKCDTIQDKKAAKYEKELLKGKLASKKLKSKKSSQKKEKTKKSSDSKKSKKKKK